MRQPLNTATRPEAGIRLELQSDDVAAKVIDGEALIMNVSNGMYYSLTGTGAVAWELLAAGCTLADAAAAMHVRFEVSEERALADLGMLADRLLAEGLVRSSLGVSDSEGARVASAGRLPYEAPTLESYSDMADLLALDPPMPGLAEPAWIDGAS